MVKMLKHFGITDTHWPFHGVVDWKKRLHDWIDLYAEPEEKAALHKHVSQW
jgi:hypothetical protein